jgi:hypothetical protein
MSAEAQLTNGQGDAPQLRVKLGAVPAYADRPAAPGSRAGNSIPSLTVTLKALGLAFDRSHFRRIVSMAVSSLEQDQSEWQIECQNRAREGYLGLVGARARSCFSRSTRSTCRDGT